MHARRSFVAVVALCSLFTSVWLLPDAAASEGPREPARPLAEMAISASRVDWLPLVDYERLVLTVAGPGNLFIRQEFKAKETPVFELVSGARDGAYTYELRLVPRIDASLRKALAEARKSGDAAAIAWLRAELPESPIMSGGFLVQTGAIVVPEGKEPQVRNVTAADQVFNDDLIVKGSACVGTDCVNGENFGSDTLRLKGLTPRIKFEDTSTSPGFASNDWQITANDSESGGANKFSVEDITGAKIPFTITAGAPDNSLYIRDNGYVGLGTSTPADKVHILESADENTIAIVENPNTGQGAAGAYRAMSNSAAVDLKAHGSGRTLSRFGQTLAGWSEVIEIGGSGLIVGTLYDKPLVLGTNSTNRIHIASSGNVGIGTASPTKKLTIKSDTANQNVLEVQRSQTDNQVIMRLFETSDGAGLISLFDSAGNEDIRVTGSGGHNWLSGTVGINCNNPGSYDFSIKSGTNADTGCNTGTFSQIDAGQTQFTISSSRTLKKNLQVVHVSDILDKIAAIDVYTYDFIDGAQDKLGLMAEDFHTVFRRGSDKLINGQEVEMALWLAVRELTAQNKELSKRLSELEARLEAEHVNVP